MNFRILLYWVIVSVPLGWGVAQSINAALPLFGMKSVYIPGFTVPPPAPAKPAAAATPRPASAMQVPLEIPAPSPAAAVGTPAN